MSPGIERIRLEIRDGDMPKPGWITCQMYHAMASKLPAPVPIRLKLPEVVELLVTHFECTEEHARDLVERAVYGGSLQDITTHYSDGVEFPTEISAW